MGKSGKAFPVCVDLARLPALAQYLKDLWLRRHEMAVGMTPNWGQ